MEITGEKIEKLKYEGNIDKGEFLTCTDVRALVDALIVNDVFQGPLDLSDNKLSTLSALYLKEAIARPGAKNLTRLSLANNKNLSAQAGIFIGDALKENVDHPIEKLSFKGVYLGDEGLVRILEACNENKNIKKVNLGIVTSRGLGLIAKYLALNKSLVKIKFQEHETEKLQEREKLSFVEMLKVSKPNLRKISFIAATDKNDETQVHKEFAKEVEFFVKKIKKEQKSLEEYHDRLESCSNEKMFKSLLALVEDQEEHDKMHVRKFYNNTFGTLLNDAISALLKKQSKSTNKHIFTMQGSIRFVAQYLQDHLPDNEAGADSEEEAEETDEV